VFSAKTSSRHGKKRRREFIVVQDGRPAKVDGAQHTRCVGDRHAIGGRAAEDDDRQDTDDYLFALCLFIS
jgi:hypothetical protein